MFFRKSQAFLLLLYLPLNSSIGFLMEFLMNFSFNCSVSFLCFSSHCGKSCAESSISACMAFKSSIKDFFSSSGSSSKASGLKTSPFFTGATTKPTGMCSKETLLPLAFFCKILIYSSFFCLYFSLTMLRAALYSSLSKMVGIVADSSSIKESTSFEKSAALPAGKLMAFGLCCSSKL